MSDLTREIQEILGTQLRQQSDYDVIDVVPIPAHADRMVRLRTIEEILSEFEATEDGNSVMGYFVQLKARPQIAKPTPSEVVPPPPPPIAQKAAGPDGIYQTDGKLNLPYLIKNADLLFSMGDYPLARNIYRAILQSGERTGLALFGIAKCFEAEGKIREAQANYEESIAYHPTLEAYQKLATLLIQQRKDQQAAEVLERALNFKDLAPSIRFELHKACGNCWTRCQNQIKAERQYQRALEINPSADEIQANLGALYLQIGKVTEAKRFFQDAIASNPMNDKALTGLGSCFSAEGDKRTAHDYFAKALDIDLKNPTAIFHLVKCAYEIKSYATAARILEEYIQTAPINVNLLYSLGGLQYHLGRIKEAKTTTQKILELNSQHSGAMELMNLIDRYAGNHF